MNVAGAVLAAGLSRRMGRNKALLEAQGRTFLDSLAMSLAQGGCHPVLAVTSGPTQSVRAACKLDGVQLIVNPDPSRGQISSLRCALDAVARADGLVLVLVDQGWVDPGTVGAVRQALGEAPLAVARYRGQAGHPVGFARELFDPLHSTLADEGAVCVVDQWAQTGRVSFVDVEDSGVSRNINTPEDYDAFLRQWDPGRPP